MNRYLAVNRIEFAITYLCNSQCKHCQLGEEEARREFPSHIDRDLAVKIVRKVGKEYHPKSIMTFGGEPLLYPEIVYAIHKEAMKAAIPVRDVITNGFWSRNIAKIRETARKLVESGVNKVSISIDCFHQEFIPIDVVKYAAESLLRAGMPHVSWNPCWVLSQRHGNQYNQKTKSILKKLEDLPIPCSEGNIAQPEGRATRWLRNFLPRKVKMPKGRCGDMPYTEELDSVKAICVEPDGKIAVCKEFHIGNAHETNVIDIIERYDPFKIQEAKAIVTNGMEGLLKWAETKGISPDTKGYYNICHMCTDIRKRLSSQ